MVRAHDHQLVGQHLQRAEDVVADRRVLLHLLELFLGELSGLAKDRVRDADLADVMQPSAALQPHPRGLVMRCVVHVLRDHQRVLRHALRVPRGVAIPRVGRVGQRDQGLEDDVLAVLEQARVVDRHRRLRRQLGDQVAVVGCERMAQLVVGQEDDAQRLAAERDGDAQHGAWVERALGLRHLHARLHDRLARLHHAAADVAAELERKLLGRRVVGAKTALQDQATTVLQRETPDLRGRSLGRTREHLLQDLVEVEGRGCRLQRLLQVAQLPDAALVLLVQLRVADGDDPLAAQRRQDALVVRRPFALLVVEDREGSPQLTLFEHRRADRGLDAPGSEVGRRRQVRARVEVGDRGRALAQHDRAHQTLAVLKRHAVDLGGQPGRDDDRLVPPVRGPRDEACGRRRHAHGGFQCLLLQDPRALSHGGERLGDLAQGVQGHVKARRLAAHDLQDA